MDAVAGIKVCRDLSAVKSLSLYIRGTGTRLTVALHSDLVQGYGMMLDIPATPISWTRYVVQIPTDLRGSPDRSDTLYWSNASRFITDITVQVNDQASAAQGKVWLDSIAIHY